MTRVVILAVLVIAAVVIAYFLQRRRPEPPSAPSYRAPAQLDRNDFVGPASLPFVVVFGSTTCNTCPVVWEEVEAIHTAAGPEPGYLIERIDVQTDPRRHERYKIDGVPTTLVADADGVVTASFFGPLRDGALAAAIAGIVSP